MNTDDHRYDKRHSVCLGRPLLPHMTQMNMCVKAKDTGDFPFAGLSDHPIRLRLLLGFRCRGQMGRAAALSRPLWPPPSKATRSKGELRSLLDTLASRRGLCVFCMYVELGGSLYFMGHLSGYTLPYSQNVTCASFPTTPCYTGCVHFILPFCHS